MDGARRWRHQATATTRSRHLESLSRPHPPAAAVGKKSRLSPPSTSSHTPNSKVEDAHEYDGKLKLIDTFRIREQYQAFGADSMT
jgi:hypothetical protein